MFKAIPLQAWTVPQASRKLTLPEFLDDRHTKAIKSSALRTGPPLPPGDTRGAHFC